MREIRLYSSEGGGGAQAPLPTPINSFSPSGTQDNKRIDKGGEQLQLYFEGPLTSLRRCARRSDTTAR